MLRLLRGEDLELVSRELGVTAAELSAWRDAFLAAGETALKTRPAHGRDVEIGRLKAKAGELTMANGLLDAKIDRLETYRPFARRRGHGPRSLAFRKPPLRHRRGEPALADRSRDRLPPPRAGS